MERVLDHPSNVRWRLPLFVTLGYLLFGVLWISVSDHIVLRLVNDSERLTVIQTYKGWAFVALSAALLYAMLAFSLTRLFHTREALERTRIEYRHLVRAISDGIWIRDTDGSTLFVNDALARMVGIDNTELRRFGVQPFLRDSSGARLEDEEDLIAQRSQTKKLVQIIVPEGTVRWALLSVNPVVNATGDLLGDLVIITDITDRITSERALREANESQRRLLDELHHRVRNNLASLHSLLDMTRLNECDTEQAVECLHARITAMSTAHDLLSDSNWQPVSLKQLLERITEGPFSRCIELSGPAINIKPEFVSPLAGAMAELFSHARVEGAIQDFTGRVSVTWSGSADDGESVTLEWAEQSERTTCDWRFDEAELLIRGLVHTDLRGSVSIDMTDATLVARLSLPMEVVSGARVMAVAG